MSDTNTFRNETAVRFYLSRDRFFGETISIRAGYFSGGRPVVMLPAQFCVRKPGEEGCELEPAFNISRDSAQSLMDELWNIGIRPTEGSGSAGSLAATERHLQDMRALVFKTKAQ